jgi:prepilin-type N-terminal cleavage/methylation domain-containing protein
MKTYTNSLALNISNPMARRRCAGFTLIEVIVTLAILAIVAAALGPVLMKQMDRLFRETEAKHLSEVAGGLKASIMRNKYIPSEADWVALVAKEVGISESSVSNSVLKIPRVFLIDPALRIDNTQTNLPYQQNRFGAKVTDADENVIPPVSPRILILSSLGSVPLPIASGTPTNAAVFNDIWNTGDGSVPPNWPTWANKGNDLLIQRINLSHLFKRVVIQSPEGTPGYYSIDESNLVFADALTEAFFLETTVIGLHDKEQDIELSHVLVGEANFYYVNEIWKGFLPKPPEPRRFQTEMTVEMFLESNRNVNAGNQPQATPAIVFTAFKQFLNDYEIWAKAGFPSSQKDNPTWDKADYAQKELSQWTIDLMNNPACQ